METTSIIILFLYLVVLFVIGFIAKNRIKTVDDYILGGRMIPWILISASFAANDIGAGASLGVMQSAANQEGITAAWYMWLMIPAYLIGLLIAPKMRNTGVKTIPEFLEMKYGQLMRKIAAFFMIIPNIGIIAINFTASASILHLLLGISFLNSMILSILITSIYSYFGGMIADVLNDAIQLIVLIVGFSAVAFYIYTQTGYTIPVDNVININNNSITKLVSILFVYVSNFMMGVATSNRIYSSKSPREIVKSILTVLPLYFVFSLVPVYIGCYISTTICEDFNSIYSILNGLKQILPSNVLILVHMGIIAASLSTVDTLLIGCSTMLINDILRPKKEKNTIKILRLCVLLFSLLGGIIAVTGIEDVISFLIFVLSLQSSALIIPFLWGHFYNHKIPERLCLLCVILSSGFFITASILNIEYLFVTPFLVSVIIGFICMLISCKFKKSRTT